jgi:hypothetical protein
MSVEDVERTVLKLLAIPSLENGRHLTPGRWRVNQGSRMCGRSLLSEPPGQASTRRTWVGGLRRGE